MAAKQAVISCAVVGVLIPLGILIVDRMSSHGWWPDWIIYVWPTSYMFVATSAVVDRFWYEVAALSVSLNALLYGVVGGLLMFLLSKASHPTNRGDR